MNICQLSESELYTHGTSSHIPQYFIYCLSKYDLLILFKLLHSLGTSIFLFDSPFRVRAHTCVSTIQKSLIVTHPVLLCYSSGGSDVITQTHNLSLSVTHTLLYDMVMREAMPCNPILLGEDEDGCMFVCVPG